MHIASPDGKTLVFADAFGLTRLLRPGKLKTERTLGGAEGQPTIDAAGARLLAYNGNTYRAEVRALPSLEKVRPFSIRVGAESRLHPDGEHVVEPRGPRLRLHTLEAEDAQGQFAFEGRDLGELALGPAREPANPPSGLSLAPDGSYALLLHDGSLAVGRLEGTRLVPAWQAQLAPGVGRLALYPSAQGTLLVRHSAAQGRAYLAWVRPDGQVERRELETWGPPELHAGRLCYQASEGQVVREPWAGGEAERFSLGPEAGEGELMPCGDGLYFLPWHAESLRDVVSGQVLPRKLPSAEEPARRYLTSLLRTLHAAGRPAEARFGLEPPRISTGKWPRFSQSTHPDGGDGSLLSRLAEGVARLPAESIAHGGAGLFGLGSYGMSGVGRLVGTATEEDVLACLAACDAQGLWITDLLTALESDYDAAGGYRRPFASSPAPTGAALLEPRAGSLLLWAVLETIARGERFPLLPAAPGWRATPLSPTEAARRVQALAERDWQRPFGLAVLLARALAHHYGAEATEPLAALLITHPDGFTRANTWQVLEVAKGACARWPALRGALLAACARAGGGDQAEMVRGTLAAG